MTDKLRASTEDLRRLVAAEWWEWVDRMLVDHEDGAVVPVRHVGARSLWVGSAPTPMQVRRSACLPVVSDPATAGCLLELFMRRATEVWEGCSREAVAESLFTTDRSIDAYASLGDFLVAALLEL